MEYKLSNEEFDTLMDALDSAIECSLVFGADDLCKKYKRVREVLWFFHDMPSLCV